MTAEYYENAYNSILNTMPKWKQIAIKEDSINNNMSGILTEFLAKVIEQAEKDFELNKNKAFENLIKAVESQPEINNKSKVKRFNKKES